MTLALVPITAMLLDSNDQMATNAVLATLSAFWFVFVALFIFQMYCYWRVAQKSGYPGSYSLLLLIPLVNIVIMLMWVFSEWPIEAELKRLRGSHLQP
jgi:surface polysaccharide O-acyltransferase-like enzyme